MCNTVLMNLLILNHVVPNVEKRLPESACLVLGRALMCWLLCLEVGDKYVPADLKEKVLADWALIPGGAEVDTAHNGNDDDDKQINPKQEVAVSVSVDQDAVIIDTIGSLEGEGASVGWTSTGDKCDGTKSVDWCAIVRAFYETRESGIKECDQLCEGEHGAKLLDGIRRLAKRPVWNFGDGDSGTGRTCATCHSSSMMLLGSTM